MSYMLRCSRINVAVRISPTHSLCVFACDADVKNNPNRAHIVLHTVISATFHLTPRYHQFARSFHTHTQTQTQKEQEPKWLCICTYSVCIIYKHASYNIHTKCVALCLGNES